MPLRESCWGVPSPNPAMWLTPLKNPSKYFFGFFKNSSALPPVFLLLVRGYHAQKGGFLPCENDTTRRTAAAHEAVNPKKICCFFCVHFWQISKSSVLDSETKKGCHFFQTAGKTQLPKRLIVGKDRAAGKVLAGKSVHSALLWFVGSKGKTPARSLL